MSENLQVELVYFYPKENSKPHKTDKFELIYDEQNPIPILRRGLKFTIAVRFKAKTYDPQKDRVRLIFNFGNYSYLFSTLIVNKNFQVQLLIQSKELVVQS
jgi:hypothetical protein